MSTLSHAYICLPAHILDANISPRAREVLMLLASQTTATNPTLWVCHAAIAEKLRCSPVTVKRAVQKLVETNLIVETGDLHERRYKFYRVRWSLDSVTPAKAGAQRTYDEDWMPACTGMTKEKPKPVPVIVEQPKVAPASVAKPKAIEQVPAAHPHATDSSSPMPQDSLFAQYYQRAHQKHLEYLRKYRIDPSSFR